jgi:TRAP-type C4-dicarboxylate transport system substrate-binding protein
VGLLATFILVPGLAGGVARAEVSLTYSDIYPATHFNGKLAQQWCAEVEKQTQGRVKITSFPGQSLTKGPECYDGVVNGLSDVGQSVLQYTRGRFPLIDFINLPLGYSSGKVATAIINEVYEKFQPRELMDAKVMYLHAHGPGFIQTKDKDVHTMADLKGLKIRSHGPTAEMLKLLGATPVALPMPELYQALQRGVVSGGVFPMESNKGWKLAEVTNRAIICYPTAYSLGFFVVMNNDKWASLSKEDQAIIEKINLQWVAKHGAAWDEADLEGKKYFQEKGGKLIDIDPQEATAWAKTVQPVVGSYLAQTKKKGLPGTEVLEYVQGRLAAASQGKFQSKYMTP